MDRFRELLGTANPALMRDPEQFAAISSCKFIQTIAWTLFEAFAANLTNFREFEKHFQSQYLASVMNDGEISDTSKIGLHEFRMKTMSASQFFHEWFVSCFREPAFFV